MVESALTTRRRQPAGPTSVGLDPAATDLHALLERLEAASPAAAIDVVADELATQLGAQAVRFLIADFSGRALVRFGPPTPGQPGAPPPRRRARPNPANSLARKPNHH